MGRVGRVVGHQEDGGLRGQQRSDEGHGLDALRDGRSPRQPGVGMHQQLHVGPDRPLRQPGGEGGDPVATVGHDDVASVGPERAVEA